MRVFDVMSKELITVGPDDNAVKVGQLLDEKTLSAAVVVQGSETLGLISKETFIANLDVICDDKPLDSYTVRDFMEADIIPLKADADIYDAVDRIQLLKKNLDRLPVLSGGKLVGILSKTELTELYGRQMKKRYKVRDLMHYSPSTVESYYPISKVVEELEISRVKSVLVTEGKNLVGIITVKDLSINLFREKRICRNPNSTSILTAADVMTRGLITTSEKEDSAKAAEVMVEKKIGSMPVVNGELKGLLTRTDLLKGFQLLRQVSRR